MTFVLPKLSSFSLHNQFYCPSISLPYGVYLTFLRDNRFLNNNSFTIGTVYFAHPPTHTLIRFRSVYSNVPFMFSLSNSYGKRKIFFHSDLFIPLCVYVWVSEWVQQLLNRERRRRVICRDSLCCMNELVSRLKVNRDLFIFKLCVHTTDNINWRFCVKRRKVIHTRKMYFFILFWRRLGKCKVHWSKGSALFIVYLCLTLRKKLDRLRNKIYLFTFTYCFLSNPALQ